jgi:Fe-S-cluster containining protein
MPENENLLEGLLTSEDCAKCRLCCIFTNYEIWETPAIGGALRAKIEKQFPETVFITKDGYSLFGLTAQREISDLFACPMLGENGCKLGAEKPFECAVWPFRIMKLEDKYVISVSSLCKPMMNKPLSAMLDILSGGLEEKLKNYARANPSMIKIYSDGYPIIKFTDISRS